MKKNNAEDLAHGPLCPRGAQGQQHSSWFSQDVVLEVVSVMLKGKTRTCCSPVDSMLDELDGESCRLSKLCKL